MVTALDEFVQKSGLGSDKAVVLEAFLKFLKERGQYVEPGDLKSQFIEKKVIRDRNKIPIEVSSCLVCGHEEFEVLEDDA